MYIQKLNAYFVEVTKWENNVEYVFCGEVTDEAARLGEEETWKQHREGGCHLLENKSFVG